MSAQLDFLDGSFMQNLALRLARNLLRVGGSGGPTIRATAGVPTGNQPKGSLAIDTTNGFLYITTDGTGTWVKVGTQV